MRTKLIVFVAAVGALAVTGLVAPALATFKGSNGRLLYQGIVGDREQLFAVSPDGTGVQHDRLPRHERGGRSLVSRHHEDRLRTDMGEEQGPHVHGERGRKRAARARPLLRGAPAWPRRCATERAIELAQAAAVRVVYSRALLPPHAYERDLRAVGRP